MDVAEYEMLASLIYGVKVELAHHEKITWKLHLAKYYRFSANLYRETFPVSSLVH